MDARLRISASANTGEYLVEIWDQGFPGRGAPTLASGIFGLGDLDEGTQTRQDILNAVRKQTNADPIFREAGKRLFGLLI